MYLSLDWIKEFTDVPSLSPRELGETVTLHTAEVEGVMDAKELYDKVVIGQIKEVAKHPDADRLNVTQTDIGGDMVQIVCGGQNLTPGMLVAVALPGASVDVHGEGLFEIKAAKIRGQESHGMICAGEEIWMEPDNEPGAKNDVKIKDLSHLDAKPGTNLASALGREDMILDIDNKSLTHRPDLWGHYGFAREVATIFKNPLKPLDELLSDANGTEVTVQTDIQDADICSRFSAAVMTGIEIAESPEWMKQRLEAAGMNAHNNIVDITNYVMLELGQPMHAYDRKVVGSDHFIVRKAKAGETLLTLEGEEHELHPEDPLVCNKENEPMGIGGIKGGMKSGISNETTEIILEAAHFDRVVVRKASTRIGLRTDASQRFEKGLDPSMTEVAIRRAIKLIQELCPNAKVLSGIDTAGDWKDPALTIEASVNSINKKMGITLDASAMEDILTRLGFGVEINGDVLKASVPSHRSTGDVDTEEDLVEEIARMHGYDNIDAELPELSINLPMENVERDLEHHAREVLAYGLGFTEFMNYSFYGKDRMEACYLNEEGHIKVLNYLSEDQTHMRVSMTPNMLASIAKNAKDNEYIKAFELGRCYKEIGTYMPQEEKWLNGAIASKFKDEVFYEIRGAFNAFMEQFSISAYKLVPSQNVPAYAHPKKCMDILFRGKPIGVLFTVHPGVLKNFGIEHQVGIFALNFGALVAHGQDLADFTEPNRFPSMSFDVSVLVDKRAEVATLEKAIRSADKQKLITSVALFDIYEGKNIPEDKKSLSFNVTLQAAEKTLTDAEFQEIRGAALLALENQGATIRGT